MKDGTGKINVGISIASTDSGTIWDSGLNQNLAFLVMLLRHIDEVGKVYLLNGGPTDQLPPAMGFAAVDAPLVRPEQVTFELDVVIEMGVNLSLEWMRHLRALGAKIITLFVGHTYTGQAEGPVFGRSTGTTFIDTPWHEIWTLPHHQKVSAPVLRTLCRVPVHEMPYLWSPLFVQRQADECAARGLEFGFKPEGARPWRLGIFEPNISVVKNCTIPMLVCDQAYRTRRDAVGLMMVMNTLHMKEHATFNRFAANLDLTRDSKATYEPRLIFVECMAAYRLDAVVAHQWECGLNNSYYDALHGGYPLVHNSEFLRDEGLGFYYPGFEARRGAEVLLDAWSREPGAWADYRSHSHDVLKLRSPDHDGNVRAYRERLLAAVEGRHG